ncbi:MAG: hypothetical protein KIS73_25060 [Enhydrobacter sp.]|nr:hypothetical protein [Enhydrobacter sp.]
MSNPDNRRDMSLVEALQSGNDQPDESVRRLRRANRRAGKQSEGQTSSTPNDVAVDGARGGTGEARALLGPAAFEGDEVERHAGAKLRALPLESSDIAPPPLTLPQRRRSKPWGGIVSFFLCVLAPTIAAAIYYIYIASNQYVVEWRFTIRDTSSGTSTTAAASALTGLLGAASGAAIGPDNYMVTEYIKSEQAVIDLEKRIGLRALYAKPSIDYWSRIDASLPIERFVRYWDYMVKASFDQITGTALAEVKAFSPEDALLIGNTLLELTEELVNETSQRPLWESVRAAEAEVTRAQDRLRKIRTDMTEYRNKAAVIDPTSSVVLTNATVASTLRQTIAQYESQLSAVRNGGVGKDAAQVESLTRRIKAAQDQVKSVEAEVTKAKGDNQSLSEIVGRYEELDLERQFGQLLLTSAMQSLETTRANATAKRLFVVPYVRPQVPQSSTYPNRAVAIATVAGACTMIWTVGLLLGRSIREHLA